MQLLYFSTTITNLIYILLEKIGFDYLSGQKGLIVQKSDIIYGKSRCIVMKKNMFQILNTLLAALFAGFLIGILQLLLFYFNMIEIDPKSIVESVVFFEVRGNLLTYILYLVINMLISLIIATVYYFLLKRTKGWLPGAIYGIILWVIFYCFLPFIIVNDMLWNIYQSETTVISLCMSLLYGIFIGYSISYNYNNM